MSGYLQYSNYGEDEPPMKRKVTPSADATKPNQSTQPTQPTQPNQPKRILRTNQRTLRSKPQPQLPQTQTQTQTQTQQTPTPTPHAYVQELIQNIHSYEEDGSGSDSDDNNYAPNAAAMQQQFQTEAVPNRNRFAGASGADLTAKWNPAPSKEAFSLQDAAALANKYLPSVFQASNASPENKDVLLQKLDHIISLLEDQRDEKTGHVTEELVLYCFLGVFIIFIVDSFARAGKYVR